MDFLHSHTFSREKFLGFFEGRRVFAAENLQNHFSDLEVVTTAQQNSSIPESFDAATTRDELVIAAIEAGALSQDKTLKETVNTLQDALYKIDKINGGTYAGEDDFSGILGEFESVITDYNAKVHFLRNKQTFTSMPAKNPLVGESDDDSGAEQKLYLEYRKSLSDNSLNKGQITKNLINDVEGELLEKIEEVQFLLSGHDTNRKVTSTYEVANKESAQKTSVDKVKKKLDEIEFTTTKDGRERSQFNIGDKSIDLYISKDGEGKVYINDFAIKSGGTLSSSVYSDADNTTHADTMNVDAIVTYIKTYASEVAPAAAAEAVAPAPAEATAAKLRVEESFSDKDIGWKKSSNNKGFIGRFSADYRDIEIYINEDGMAYAYIDDRVISNDGYFGPEYQNGINKSATMDVSTLVGYIRKILIIDTAGKARETLKREGFVMSSRARFSDSDVDVVDGDWQVFGSMEGSSSNMYQAYTVIKGKNSNIYIETTPNGKIKVGTVSNNVFTVGDPVGKGFPLDELSIESAIAKIKKLQGGNSESVAPEVAPTQAEATATEAVAETGTEVAAPTAADVADVTDSKDSEETAVEETKKVKVGDEEKEIYYGRSNVEKMNKNADDLFDLFETYKVGDKTILEFFNIKAKKDESSQKESKTISGVFSKQWVIELQIEINEKHNGSLSIDGWFGKNTSDKSISVVINEIDKKDKSESK